MMEADRERMLEALMAGLERAPEIVRRELREMFTVDLDRLEPIVDEIIERESVTKQRVA